MARPLDDPIDRLLVRVTSPTALEALMREIRRRARVSTRTTVVLQTFLENRAHPVVGQDVQEPADWASSP
jgi:hypothetical protein